MARSSENQFGQILESLIMEGSKESYRAGYPDQHDACRVQYYRYALNGPLVAKAERSFQDCSPPVWTDSFVYTRMICSSHFYVQHAMKKVESTEIGNLGQRGRDTGRLCLFLRRNQHVLRVYSLSSVEAITIH